MIVESNRLQPLEYVNDEEVEVIESDIEWAKTYPHLSRDCGAKLHQLIEDGKVPSVSLIEDSEARWWCEGFYTIDFKQRVFITEYHGNVVVFNLDSLPTDEEYLSKFAVE